MLTDYPINPAVCRQYQLIKLAWNEYQCAPESLDAAILAKLEAQAEMASRLMAAVLGTAESLAQSVSVQEVDFAIEQLQSQFDNLDDFKLCLDKQKMSKKQLQQVIYRELICEKTIEAQSRNVPEVKMQEALDYYQKNRDKFSQPERRKISHILITINDQYPDNKRAVARNRIDMLRESLVDNIDDFSQLAMQNSECPSALNNGLIGTVTRGQLYSELDNVLFLMQEQTVSSIVESEIGFHILLCHEIYPPSEQKQEDALQAINKQLYEHRKKKQQKKWITSLFAAN